MKAIIVGAGIIGSSVAFRLAQAGVEVTVLEAAYIGAGTSSTTFAWMNSNRKPPRTYHDLNVAGMAAYLALASEFDDTSWCRVTGNLEWTHSEQSRRIQRERVERLQSWEYRAQWIDRAELAELEPDISPDVVGDAQIAYFPDEGLVDPVVYSAAMMKAAVSRYAAKLRLGVRVSGFELRGARVTAAKSVDGTRYEGDVIINCAGRWVNELANGNPMLAIPMAPTVGFLVFTPPTPTTINRPLHAPDINLRPDGAGRLMMRSEEGDTSVTLETPRNPLSSPALQIMASAARLVPALGNMRPEAVRIALRSIPADDISAVGALPGVDGYYVCVTHSGVTLAPVLGQAVADEVVQGTSKVNLDPFRPARFFVKAVA